ncbi:MAG: hypothetical protein IPM23_11545 [Candidatus Melainabacteria bacterium]|nr:hypothetical protein [Candidatus Melainabacteria bacterium]
MVRQTSKEERTLIGDLLVRSGLIERSELTHCLAIARQSRLPIGQVLTVNGYVSQEELMAGLRIQALMRERLIAEDEALEALGTVRRDGVALEQALEAGGWKSEYHTFTQNLGKLLVDAGVVDGKQLEVALGACHSSGLPLARVLVLQGSLSEFVAYAALTAQTLLRDNKIARDQAVGALRLTSMHGDSIEDYLEFGGLRKIRPDHVLRLGEMLVLSELVTELDLLSAVETGLMEAQPIGHILMNTNDISPLVVDAGLKLQDMIRENKVAPIQAVEILKRVAASGMPVEQIALPGLPRRPDPHDLPGEDGKLLEFVHGLSFLSDADLERIIRELKESGTPAEPYLLERGLVEPHKINAARRCRELVDRGHLTLEQGIFAVHIWLWSGGELDDVLARIGWLAP